VCGHEVHTSYRSAVAELARIYITDMETQLETYRRPIIEQTPKSKRNLQSCKINDSRNAFEIWMESLPFPIASILWAYNAESNSEKKAEHLLHFFEALAELLALISLSCFCIR